MKQFVILFVAMVTSALAQNIPARWDELTATDWPKALEKSAGTCILPIGILEKHGPHAPIGSDLIQVREWAKRVTDKEYAVVFPDYFYGQIYEAKHQYGAFALPSKIVWELLDATCEEIARNGFTKIMIINGHGGNPYLLKFFIQSQLERRRGYAVFLYDPAQDPAYVESLKKESKSTLQYDWHAGQTETSVLLFLRPDLVKMEYAGKESGDNLKRLSLPDIYTGIGWYAGFPNHYAGDASKATRELGQFITDHNIESMVKALRAIKMDTKTLDIQNEYFDRVKK